MTHSWLNVHPELTRWCFHQTFPSGMLAGGVWGFLSFVFVISINYISIIPQYLQINMPKLTNPFDKNPQSPPFAQIQLKKTPKLPWLRIPDEEVQRKRLCVRSGWTLSQEWVIWTESPRSHELEFGQTFRMAGEGAPGKQKPKLIPWYSYI